MANEPNGGAPPAAGPQTPGEKAASFRILTQYIKDMSFENPQAPGSFQAVTERPKIKIEANVAARKMGDNLYESALSFEATANGKDDVVLYHLEIDYAGLFRLEGFPETAIQSMLLVNCPTLLYPFVRRLVADLTHEGGYPPLLLDPIDFHQLYVRNAARSSGQQPVSA